MKRYFGPILMAIIALILLFGGAAVKLYTDWLWFLDLGYRKVFTTVFFTKMQLGITSAVLFFAIIYGNLWYARKISPAPRESSIEMQLLEKLGSFARRGVGILIFIVSVFISVMVGLETANHWESFLKYRNAIPFGEVDPIFNNDIGFYVFQLPFIKYINGWIFFALVVTTIATAAIYYASEAIEMWANKLQFAPKVKVHLCILIALMFVVKAWGYKLGMYDMLTIRGNIFDGAGYTNIHANLPVLWLLIGAAIVGAVIVLLNSTRRGIALAVGAVIGLMGLSILAGAIYPSIIQSVIVKPNEFNKERPYLERAIQSTRKAYGLADVDYKPYEAASTLTKAQIEANASSIENIRLWDNRHLMHAYAQIQTIQQYYNFHDVDVDRYWLTDKDGNKRYRQVWLSARELSQSSLPQPSQTWVNRRLQYTHGYGFCMSPVNEISSEGLPNFYVYDIPPKTSMEIPISRSEIYYGELTDAYVIVGTKADEFSYPAGSENVTTRYAGDTGVGIGSMMRKLLFAWRYADVNILLNSDITKESKILYNREIKSRVNTLMPFLKFDDDPYLITADGRLYWMIDGYTITSAYPYSRMTVMQGSLCNYIRNSVKVVVDAYNGNVSAYIIQKPIEDPIIKVYDKIFPGVFKKFEDMPETLKSHIRYPEELFKVQAAVYTNYHNEPESFYKNSDLWAIPERAVLLSEELTGSEYMDPYYVNMKLPDGEKEEFILMIPYKRAGKKNMVSWMCARCDGDNYGEIVLYRFPQDKNVLGPDQVIARINQDTSHNR
ncbi:MAG: UPF0182 family protein, partial [Armatimonadota bacterium]